MADVPMERVIDAIEKQSSYLFAIDTNVNISQKVSVSCTDASVETALTQTPDSFPARFSTHRETPLSERPSSSKGRPSA